MSTPRSIRLPAEVRRAIVAHALREKPLECCGLLVGAQGRIQFAVPMANAERSRVRFRVDDRAHIELRRVLRDFRPAVSILGVYHSHPAGRPRPSETDVAEAFYPDWVHLIVGLAGGRSRLAAFRISRGRVREIKIVKLPG